MASEESRNGKVLATCSAACPVLTDTREYVQRISRGDYEGALDILLEVNPFPSVCGRICHHPCERECRRKEIDQPVSLRLLKRFVVENTRDYRAESRKGPPKERKGKKVAVIGSGPSGLTAARDLALAGYDVTVFEKDDKPGGMLTHAIPRYRLPAESLQDDIDDITAAGVEIRTGCAVGSDVSFKSLQDDYDAILIAAGLADSHSLPIPGMESDGVLLGMPFLWDAAYGKQVPLGSRILVIGGGNVAIDTARTARRLASNADVFLACLESRKEMPAWSWEIEEAEEERIEIMNSWGPKAILESGGKVTGIEFKRCTQVFDENGRFSPAYDENETTTLELDNVIVTIGQKSNLGFLDGSGAEMDRGRLVCDRSTMTTSLEGVFCTGEVMTGPGAAIQAVASGHDAAKLIESYLETGKAATVRARVVESIGAMPKETAGKARSFSRVEVELTDPADRIQDFAAIEPGFTEAMALKESRRCLACATGAVLEDPAVCAGCLTCVRVCPYGVATVERTAAMPADQCLTCGICAAECPAAGIALARFSVNKMKEQLDLVMIHLDEDRISRPFIVSYCCQNETTTRKFLVKQSEKEIMETGVLRVMVPCVGRLSAQDLLAPFEQGADGVAVIACGEDNCLYAGSEDLLKKRLYKVKNFLSEIGMGMGALQYCKTEGSAEESWPGIWKEMREKLTKVEA